MYRPRIAASLCAICLAIAFAAKADDTDILNAQVRFICQWMTTQDVPAGAPSLNSCKERSPPDLVVKEVTAFWGYWAKKSPSTFGAASDDFNAKWQAHEAVLNREADDRRRAAAVKKRHAFLTGLPGMTMAELCVDYARTRSKEVRDELRRRPLPKPDEWQLIEQRQIRIGMSETALLCSRGSTRVNRTVTVAGEDKQYVYDGVLIYVKNGAVVAWQD